MVRFLQRRVLISGPEKRPPSRLRFPKRSAVLMVLLVAMVMVAVAYAKAAAQTIAPNTPELTLRAGQTQTVSFTYRAANADTSGAIAGSGQADVALMELCSQSPGTLCCTVQALAPGKAVLYAGLSPQNTAAMTVTVIGQAPP